MWTYEQSNGTIRYKNALIGQGYSGYAAGKNQPAAQGAENVGPIPRGRWAIASLTVEKTEHGPYVLRLEPEPGTETFGRSGFLIHGDSVKTPGEASKGCVILSRPIREQMWISGDRTLEVNA